MAIIILRSIKITWVTYSSKVLPPHFLEGSTGYTIVQSRALALVRGLRYMQLSSHHSVRKYNDYWGIYMIIKHQLHFRTGWVGKAWRAHGFVPSRGSPPARTPTPLSRPFRHRFGPVQAFPLYVPVSPSPVSREASRDMWRSIGPSTMVAFKLRTSLSVCKYNNSRFNLHVDGETTFISPIYLRNRRDSREWCFWRAMEEEDSRASHKRRQNSSNFSRGGKVMRASHRLGGGVGRREEERERRRMTRRGIRAVDPQLDFKTVQVGSKI